MQLQATNVRVSLQDWFKTYLRRPALLFDAAVVLGLASWSLVEFRGIGREQNAAVEQLGNSLTFAINQHDRSFAEHLIASHLSRGGVVEVAVCEGERLLISLPEPGASCHGKIGLFSSVSKAQIKGSSSKYVVSTFSRRSIALKFMFGLLICLAAAGLIKRMISGMTKRFSKDVIAPIAANLRLSSDSSDAPALIATVTELQQLYDAHRSSIDETKRLLEDNAKQSRNAAMAFLVQTVAHDVRKPFSRVNAGLRVLSEEAEDLDEESPIARRIQALQQSVASEVNSVEDMLTDIMDYGATTIADPTTTSLSQLAMEALSQYRTQVADKKIVMVENFESGVSIKGNYRKLKRAIENLMENAIEAMPAMATLTVCTAIVGEQARISISNTGSTIPEAIREKLFQPFVTSGKSSGTGLGLAIVSRIAEQHQGRVWCESDMANGTMFTLEFPLCAVESEDSVVANPSASQVIKQSPRSGTLNIALIEDDIWVQEDWEATEGLKVRSYETPAEFLALLESDPEALNSIDVVVTDYYFDSDDTSAPPLTGDDVLARVRILSNSLPVLLASNATSDAICGSFTSSIGKKPLSVHAFRALLDTRELIV